MSVKDKRKVNVSVPKEVVSNNPVDDDDNTKRRRLDSQKHVCMFCHKAQTNVREQWEGPFLCAGLTLWSHQLCLKYAPYIKSTSIEAEYQRSLTTVSFPFFFTLFLAFSLFFLLCMTRLALAVSKQEALYVARTKIVPTLITIVVPLKRAVTMIVNAHPFVVQAVLEVPNPGCFIFLIIQSFSIMLVLFAN